jgi:hypothetical protein
MPAFLETGSGLPVSLSALIVDLDIDVEGLHPAKWIPGLDVQAISAVRDRHSLLVLSAPLEVQGAIVCLVVSLVYQVTQPSWEIAIVDPIARQRVFRVSFAARQSKTHDLLLRDVHVPGQYLQIDGEKRATPLLPFRVWIGVASGRPPGPSGRAGELVADVFQ